MSPVLVLTLVIVGTTIATNPCCQTGNNTLVQRKCSDGSSIRLTCPKKYLTSLKQQMRIDDDQNLVISSSKIPPDRYCASRLNDSAVMVVCLDEHAHSDAIFVVYASLEIVSVFFILATVFVYVQVPDLLDLQGACILNSISGLAVSFLTLATNQLIPYHIEKKTCMFLAYITYFTMLYSFFWLNMLAFHIWRIVVNPKILAVWKYWRQIYYAVGCGGPLLLLVVLIIAHSMSQSDIHPGFGESKCWFKSTKTQFVYFYGPIAVLLFFNVIYYGWTIATLWRHFKHVDEKKTKILRYRLLLCVKMFFIMGISWIFELLSAALQDDSPVRFLWYVTDGLNTLQGILIFLILVVFRKRVVRGLANRSICGVRLPGRWGTVMDDECEENEEELNLSETTHQQKS